MMKNFTGRSARGPLVALAMAALVGAAAPGLAADEDPAASDFPPMSLDQDPKPAPAAEAPPMPWRTFELVTGVTYSSVSSTLRVGRGGGGGGLAMDAEGTLGLSRELLSPEVWVSYRLAERHRISFSFQDMTRTATRTLQRDIVVDGTTYAIGTDIHTVYGVQFFELTYAWSFLQDDRMEMALTFGFDTLRAHFSIEATNTQLAANERFIFPIPLPGANADFQLIPDLWLRERLQLMYVPVQNYAGLLIDLDTALEYSFVKNVSLGLGFNIFRVELEKKANGSTWGNFEGDFKYNSAGVLIYINFHL
jgi:hypothetical protein